MLNRLIGEGETIAKSLQFAFKRVPFKMILPYYEFKKNKGKQDKQ